MLDAAIMVRVSTETHNQLKEACQQNKRSMQSVVVALVEGWLENGAPEPFGYGAQKTESKPEKSDKSLDDLQLELVLRNARDIERQGLRLELLTRQVADLEGNLLEISRLEQELGTLRSEVGCLRRILAKVNDESEGGSRGGNPSQKKT